MVYKLQTVVNMKSTKLILVLGMAIFGLINVSVQAQDSTKRLGEYDSTRHISRAYNKIAFQMKRFNEVVNSYVKQIKKAKPADSNITGDVEMYSDSLNMALESSDKKDTQSMAKIRVMFDSLVKASVRLVKSVENDSALKNNKAIKQMNIMMDNLRESIDKYQQELNESRKRKEDGVEPEGEPEPAPVETPKTEKPKSKK